MIDLLQEIAKILPILDKLKLKITSYELNSSESYFELKIINPSSPDYFTRIDYNSGKNVTFPWTVDIIRKEDYKNLNTYGAKDLTSAIDIVKWQI